MKISKSIKFCRKVRGWTQSALAQEAGVDTATISRIENGQIKNPSKEIIKNISKALNITSSDLISLRQETDKNRTDVLRIGFGHCIWAVPLIKIICEEGGLIGTEITSFGIDKESSGDYFPIWHTIDQYHETATIQCGPNYINYNNNNEHSSYPHLKLWDEGENGLGEIYTADDLIRLMNADKIDCMLVPGEIYSSHRRKLIRAATITYTSKGGCKLCVIGKHDIFKKLNSDLTIDREDSDKITPEELWKTLQEYEKIPIIYSKRTISEKYLQTYLLGQKIDAKPISVDFGKWTSMAREFSHHLDKASLFLFLCWEPQMSWVLETFANQPDTDAIEFDFFELNSKQNIPFVSFDVMFSKSSYRKWKDENYEVTNSFFSSLETSINQLSEAKGYAGIDPDAELIGKYLNMPKKRCAEALSELNFRFTYYPEWWTE